MMSKFHYSFWLACIGVLTAFFLAGCASSAGSLSGSHQPAERWHDFGPGALAPAEPNWASVVFLRDKTVHGRAANIFVNGEYLTSLLPGGFKQGTVCAGSNRFTTHYTDVKSRYFEKEREGQHFQTPAEGISYFRVVADKGGALALQPLAVAEARQLMAGMQEQTHTISRVDGRPRCSGVGEIASQKAGIDRTEVIDHADPEGGPEGSRAQQLADQPMS